MDDIKFIIMERDSYYTIAIDSLPKYQWTNLGGLFTMDFRYQWEKLLNSDIDELRKYLIENYNPYAKIGPHQMLCWRTKEDAQGVIEYLESLLIMEKLTK